MTIINSKIPQSKKKLITISLAVDTKQKVRCFRFSFEISKLHFSFISFHILVHPVVLSHVSPDLFPIDGSGQNYLFLTIFWYLSWTSNLILAQGTSAGFYELLEVR